MKNRDQRQFFGKEEKIIELSLFRNKTFYFLLTFKISRKYTSFVRKGTQASLLTVEQRLSYLSCIFDH